MEDTSFTSAGITSVFYLWFFFALFVFLIQQQLPHSLSDSKEDVFKRLMIIMYYVPLKCPFNIVFSLERVRSLFIWSMSWILKLGLIAFTTASMTSTSLCQSDASCLLLLLSLFPNLVTDLEICTNCHFGKLIYSCRQHICLSWKSSVHVLPHFTCSLNFVLPNFSLSCSCEVFPASLIYAVCFLLVCFSLWNLLFFWLKWNSCQNTT